MLPASAHLVVLLLNGVQPVLPSPAYVSSGRVWVPGRAVAERLHCQVAWSAGSGALAIRHGAACVSASLRDGSAASRQGLTYVPLVSLRPLGFTVNYDAAARIASVDEPPPAVPEATSIAAVLADPLLWRGRSIALEGECLGWSPYAFCWATADAGEFAVGDFVLASAGGAVRCHPTGAGARPAGPYSSVGHALTVSGTVQVGENGVPSLACDTVRAGLETVGRPLLRAQREVYRPGDRVEALLLTQEAADDAAELIVAAPDGTANVMPVSSCRDQRSLGAGTTLLLWDLLPDASPGRYQACLRFAGGALSLPAYFRVEVR